MKKKRKQFTLFEAEMLERELVECLKDSRRVVSVEFSSDKDDPAWRYCRVRYHTAERLPVLYRFYHMVESTIKDVFDCSPWMTIETVERGIDMARLCYGINLVDPKLTQK